MNGAGILFLSAAVGMGREREREGEREERCSEGRRRAESRTGVKERRKDKEFPACFHHLFSFGL